MFIVKVQLLVIIFSYLCLRSHGLVPLAPEVNDIIRATENIVRNITNTLFTQLNLRGAKLNRKLRRLITVHNFLASVTLQDHKNFNEIVRLSRSDKRNVKNETENQIELLNEILDANLNVTDYVSTAPNDNVIKYANEFLTNLDGMKEGGGLNDDFKSLEIRNEIIDILINNNTDKSNETHIDVKSNYKEDVLLDDEFWTPDTRRIYQGRRTKIKHFPFVASIQFFNNFQCGGSIIKSDLVITAASCLQLAWNNRFFRENPAFLSVRVGSNFYNGGGERIAVQEIFFHPEYTPKTLRHNIAVMRLRRHLKFRKHKMRMKKIDIDRQDHSLPINTDGITVVGWGAKTASNIVREPWSNQIAFAVLDVYGLQECQDVYSKEFVTRKNFCAGFFSKGGGACNHDVGGPGVANGILVGIISFGAPVCGTPDAPTVFTKVGFYADWIDEIMDQDVPVLSKRTTLRKPPIELLEYADFTPSSIPIVPILTIDHEPHTTEIPNIKVEGLRNIKDEDRFTDYISTLFENVKPKEDEDLTSDNNVQTVKEEPLVVDNEKSVQDLWQKLDKLDVHVDVSDMLNDYEALSELSEFESVTQRSKKYTISENNPAISNETDHSIEENIVKLLENIDINSSGSVESKIVSKEDVERVTRFESYLATTANYKTKENTKKLQDINKTEKNASKISDISKKDNVLTLLYITDDDKSGSGEKDIVGLSIEADTFQDMNFRNNITSAVLELMSKSDITQLLNEALEDMAKIKKMKDL